MSEDTSIPFSRRFGYRPSDPEITIREDAPLWLRSEVVQIARKLVVPGHAPMSPQEIRTIVCRALRTDPDLFNSSSSYVWKEVIELLSECE